LQSDARLLQRPNSMSEGGVIAGATHELMGLRVADLRLWLDARGSGFPLVAPESHAKFLCQETPEVPSGVSGDLVLHVRNGPLPKATAGLTPLCLSDVWELWLDNAGCYVFVAPRQSPPRTAIIDSGFQRGEVVGEFSSANGEGAYPLQSLGIRIFVNWLANFGDLILHGSGMAVDGKGYCYAGSAGAGKSTLIATLALEPSVTVLGEDQVILRYLGGRFFIYGTPWHVSPDLCAPLGVPLEKLFFLDRTAAQLVAPVAPFDGVTRLLQTAFVPYYRPAAVTAILGRLSLLADHVPFYTLSYRLGDDPMPLILGA